MKKFINLIFTTLINIFITDINYDTWIFSSTQNMRFDSNSKYFFQYVLENKESNGIKPLFVINNKKLKDVLSDKYGPYFIQSDSIKGIISILKSGVWLTSAGLPVYGFNTGSNRLILNLWHGIPLKKIALLENNFPWKSKIYFRSVFSSNYTYIYTTSAKLKPIMAESFGVNQNKIKVLGQPRNDLLFSKINKMETINKFYPDLPHFSKIALYAPTYRDNQTTWLFPFREFDSVDFSRFLNDNEIIILIRTHPFEKGNHNIENERIRFINEDIIDDIMLILNIFDFLITDYSSIFFDYMLLDRPIIFLPYDISEYEKERGLNFVYNEVTPGPKLDTYDLFKETLRKISHDEYQLDKHYNKVKKDFNQNTGVVSEIIYFDILNEIKLLKNKKN